MHLALIIFQFVLFIFCLVGIYLFMAILGSIIPKNKKYRPTNIDVICYLSSDGIHTDFVLPLVNSYFDWRVLLNQNHYNIELNDYTYIGIGWGDKGFYLDIPTWNDLTFKVAANALLIPSPSVMHIIAYEEIPTHKKKLLPFALHKDQYLVLSDYISSYFRVDENNQPLHIPEAGYSSNDNFYHARDSYHAFNTCNFWINRGLTKAGVRTSLWSPSDRGIFWQLKRVRSSNC